MEASGGSREEKDDDHENNRRKRSFDRLGSKNVEGSNKKSSDEVSDQSSDQMEVVEDGLGMMFENSDRVVENSNAEFRNELVQGQNTENTGSSSHGTALNHGNSLGQSTSGTQLVLHSESSNVLGQGHAQGTGGTGSVLHSESSSRNVHGQGQQGMHSQSVAPTATQYRRGRFTVTHEQPPAISGVSRPRGAHAHNVRARWDPNIAGGNNLRPRGPLAQSGTGFFRPLQSTRNTGNSLGQGQGQGADGTGSVLHSESSNGHGQGQQGMYAQTVTPAATQYQRGRFTVTHEQPSVIFAGFQEHNMIVWSDTNIVHVHRFRQWTLQVSQFGTPISPFFPTFASQHAGLPVARPPVQSGTGFYMPRGVQQQNMRDANMVRADMFGQRTPQNAGLPVTRPPVDMGMSLNADMPVEGRDREEVVSDQGSNSEDP